MINICPYIVQVVKNRKPFIRMAIHGSLLCHLKPNNNMLTNGSYLLSSPKWMKKTMTNAFKITIYLKING